MMLINSSSSSTLSWVLSFSLLFFMGISNNVHAQETSPNSSSSETSVPSKSLNAKNTKSKEILNKLQLKSTAFQPNGIIPKKFTCDGQNISPPLEIISSSTQAKSLALILDDPDASRGTFTHWLLWNMKPSTRTIQANSVPSGSVQGKNSKGTMGYTGPCPPDGEHHYHFTVFQLNKVLSLNAGSDKKSLEQAMQNHILNQTSLKGRYQHPQ